MHLRDAQRAVGAVRPLDPDLAADGIDEVLTVFVGRQVRSGALSPVDPPVGFAIIDADRRSWVLQGDTVVDGVDPVATIAGTSESVLLALWRRSTWEGLRVEGDQHAVAALFASAITP